MRQLMELNEAETVSERETVCSHKTRVNFKNVRRVRGRRVDGTASGCAGGEVLFDKDCLPVRVEPYDVQRKPHLMHPESPFRFLVEDK